MSNNESFVNQLRNMNQIEPYLEERFRAACRRFKEECVQAARQGKTSISTKAKYWDSYNDEFVNIRFRATNDIPEPQKEITWILNAFNDFLKAENFTYINVKKHEEIRYATKRIYKKKGFWASLTDSGEEVTDYNEWKKTIEIILEVKW